jgi:hypothetical protein
MKAFSFNPMIILVVAILFSACEKDPVIPNEEELITTFQYILTPVSGGTPVMMQFNDPDGDGGLEPVIAGAVLQNNTSYSGSVLLTNTSVEPWINITEEVSEEAAEHQFFFIPENVNLEISYRDEDENSNPVGIETLLNTTGPSEGTLTIILRHLPDKTATGVKAGNIENAGGETDIEVIFPVRIQ